MKSLTLSFIAAALVSVIVYFLRFQIMELFTKDMEVVKATAKVFPWLIFIETGRTFNIVVINALHAAGDIKFPMIMGCIVMLGVAAPLSWLLGIRMEWALVGVWIANGTDKMDREDMQVALTMFYKEMGWDEKTGAATKETLK